MKYSINYGFIPENKDIFSGTYTEEEYENNKGRIVAAHDVTIVHSPEDNVTRPVLCKLQNKSGKSGFVYRDFVPVKEE